MHIFYERFSCLSAGECKNKNSQKIKVQRSI